MQCLFKTNDDSYLSKEQVRNKKYLSSAVYKVDGKVVVGVGRVVVDPQLPGDGGEDGGGKQHAPCDESLLHEGEEVCKEGEKGEKESNVSEARVGLEHTSQPNQGGGQQQWLPRKPEFDKTEGHIPNS